VKKKVSSPFTVTTWPSTTYLTLWCREDGTAPTCCVNPGPYLHNTISRAGAISITCIVTWKVKVVAKGKSLTLMPLLFVPSKALTIGLLGCTREASKGNWLKMDLGRTFKPRPIINQDFCNRAVFTLEKGYV